MKGSRMRVWWPLAVVLALSWGLSACNLGFDASSFEVIEEDSNPDSDPEVIPEGCEDDDGDSFGFGLDCPEDQLDCDDSNDRIFPGAEERCNNNDDDCDEIVDEGPSGGTLTRECYTSNGAELDHEGTTCRAGTVLCQEGSFPESPSEDECSGQILPGPAGELEGEARCDGLDNDCDGVIDPECECPEEGFEDPCYAAGPEEVAGIGACVRGVRTCQRTDDGDLIYGECLGDVGPEDETCNNIGIDDDCDGEEDNVLDLGEACESNEPGRCRPGHFECADGELVCVRNLEPQDEVCDGLDNDCDGVDDNGVDNACGGCQDLGESLPEDACGVCSDGLLSCNEEGTLDCVGARELNACNGCTDLEALPEEECGECGRFQCANTDSVRCVDPGFNACDGCGPINGGQRLGDACGNCGTFVCDGGNDVICEERESNLCGGCATLVGAPATVCGPCSDGRFRCEDDGESVFCEGARVLNACNGCQEPPGELNSPCGQCGTYQCDEENEGVFLCVDPGANVCGGCFELENDPAEPCGECGVFRCNQETGDTFCDDPGFNSCGGCEVLEGERDEACGDCGVFQCFDINDIRCADPGENSCGGCEPLEGDEGEDCGTCGVYRCSIDPNQVLCEDPGLNACDGCGDVIGPDLGTSCGICGEFECDGTNSTLCVDPGKNVCDTCGELVDVPGTACGGDCGAFSCLPNGGTECDDRECVDPSITFRIQHYIPGGPVFDILVDNLLPINGAGYQFRTVYISGPAGQHNIKVFNSGDNPILDPPLFNRNITGAPGDEFTLMFIGLPGEAGVDYDLYEFRDDNTPAPNEVKLRYIHAFPDKGPVDVVFDSNLLLSNVAHTTSSEYITIANAPVRRIEIRDAGVGIRFAGFDLGTPLKGGSVYTIIHFGRLDAILFPEFPQLLRSERDRELQIISP